MLNEYCLTVFFFYIMGNTRVHWNIEVTKYQVLFIHGRVRFFFFFNWIIASPKCRRAMMALKNCTSTIDNGHPLITMLSNPIWSIHPFISFIILLFSIHTFHCSTFTFTLHLIHVFIPLCYFLWPLNNCINFFALRTKINKLRLIILWSLI